MLQGWETQFPEKKNRMDMKGQTGAIRYYSTTTKQNK